MIDDDDYDDDYDDPNDADAAEPTTLECPDCGGEVFDDAPRCPHCGSYMTFSTSPWSGRPWWWVILGLLGTIAVILVLVWLGW